MTKESCDISPDPTSESWGNPEAEFASFPFYLTGGSYVHVVS